jgi:hypothetical protein
MSNKIALLSAPLEKVSIDVLTLFFKYLLIEEPDKKYFINFWISCRGNGALCFKTHSSMLNLNIKESLELTRNSSLSKYLTSICISISSLKKAEEEDLQKELDYCNNILEIQKACPRVKIINLKWWLRADAVSAQMLNKLFDVLSKFPKVEKLYIGPHIQLSANLISKFPNLRRIAGRSSIAKIEDDPIGFDRKFPDISTLKVGHPGNLSMFPNLTTLCLVNTSYYQPSSRIYSLDFSSMVYLEKLVFKHNAYLLADITVDGLELKSVELNNGIKLRRKLENLLINLLSIEVDACNYRDYTNFRSENLSTKAPFLEQITCSFELRGKNETLHQNMISKVANFTQITSLTISKLKSKQVNLSPLKSLVNLKKLYLNALGISPFAKRILDEIICDRITHLGWEFVSYFVDSTTTQEVAPSLSPTAQSKLIYLKACMASVDWMKLIPRLVEIEYLHLINNEICLSFDFPNGVYSPDYTYIEDHYCETPVNPDEFIMKFHICRLNRVDMILSLASDDRICKIFHFEEKHSNDEEADDDSESLRKTVKDGILRTNHNKTLSEIFDHDADCTTCTHNCNLKMHPKLFLQFTFKSWPKYDE